MIHDGAPRTIYVMGRAPNSGAPQRVSAHVVPKATASSPFSIAAGTGDDEDEKTTIESGWEDEPSTTIAQSDAEQILGVASPLRTGTNVTATNSGGGDELTVDDQHANAGLSLLTPGILRARLVVTGGNDAGQEVAVQPGKTYTIGRAVENDIVLTDIAVSRKHFDLRHEAGAWVLVDRGSGNGTLVNGNVEDHPFMLANGDAIEIGNTTFRFELPNGAPRARSSFEVALDQPLGQHDDDEEEPSTVAGKPVRYDEIATPSHIPAKGQQMQAPRAKTMPPPAPMRPRSPSAVQQPMYPPTGPMAPSMSAAMTGPMPGQLPATTLPMPQQMNQRPMGAQAPTMLGDSMGIAMPMPIPGMLPSTIPGQGPQQQQMYNPYPNNGHPNGQQQMLVVNGMPNGRDATSTSVVPPTPYGGVPVMAAPPSYVAPTIPRRTKLILGGAGLTLFAAIATVAIIKGAGGGGAPKPQPSNGSAVVKTSGKDIPKETPRTEPKLTATPIVTPPKTEPKATPPKTEPPKIESKLATVLKGDPPKVEPKVEPTIAPKIEPKIEPKIATTVAPKVEPPVVAKKDPPPKKEPKKKKEPPPKVAKKDPPPREEPIEEPPPRKEPPPKRVAMGDADGAKTKAEGLYKAKKFTEAASVMLAASKAASDPEQSKELRLKGGFYGSFGKNFNIGMAPATSAKDAWTALTAARTYDNSLGGDYIAEINSRMGEIAPKAAVAFMAGKNFVKAKEAVAVAERSGNSNSTTAGVRSSLEQKAGDLYKEADSLKSSDPAAATQKFREIQGMVDSKSPWHQKAGKALIAIKSS